MTFLHHELTVVAEPPPQKKRRRSISLTSMSSKLFRFGEFILNPQTRHLFRQREPVRLPSHAFDILLFLVQNHGTVVLKGDILQKFWPDTFVEEANLAVHVSAIRRVLGEKRGENKYIETISGRGYCFVAPVEVVEISKDKSFGHNLPLTEPTNEAGKIRSVAVLPFSSAGETPSVQYLSEGITESLIKNLAQNGQVKVFASSAVFQYQNQELNLREIGFLLGADAILTGRIVLVDEQLDISVELVNVFDQSHLWGMEYRCHFDDIFKVKLGITMAVTEKLQLKLNKAEARQLRPAFATSSEAYKIYLKGRYLLSKKTKDGFLKGIELFQRVLEQEPGYALAYSGIADSYLLLCIHHHLPASETIAKAKTAIARALAIDETLSEAHASNGHIQFRYEWKWEAAEASFKRALALNPSNTTALRWYSSLLVYLGRFKEALSYQHQALDLEPFSLHANTELGARFNYSREFGKAVKQFEETLELETDFIFALIQLSMSYTKLGLYELALEYAAKVYQLFPSWEVMIFRAWVYASAGDQPRALEMLRGALSNPSQEAIDYFELATVYAALDDAQKSFAYLEKAIKEQSISICGLKTDPRLDTLRSDPRLEEMISRVGLNEHSLPPN